MSDRRARRLLLYVVLPILGLASLVTVAVWDAHRGLWVGTLIGTVAAVAYGFCFGVIAGRREGIEIGRAIGHAEAFITQAERHVHRIGNGS